MSTIVYLSNQQLQVISGRLSQSKIQVTRCYEAEAPEGTIINGIVMDPEAFTEFIREFWKTNKLPVKDVSLVINSSKFIGKIMEIPSVGRKKSFDLIAHEFADINRNRNCLYNFLPLGPGMGKLKRIYSESIEPDFIREYLDIFHAAGVQVKSILSGESSLIKLTDLTIGRIHRNFSVLIADSNIVTTILWINGSFYYFNSTRSFHDPGTEEYAADVARSVSRLMQFMQANQIEEHMECIVLAGIPQNDLHLYAVAMENLGIMTRVELFDSSYLSAAQGIDIQKCLRSVSGLAATDKYLNFLTQYSSGSKKKKTEKQEIGINFKPIIISFAVLVLALIISIVLMVQKKKELAGLQEYNESPAVLSNVLLYDMLMEKNSLLNAEYDAIRNIDENIRTYPLGDSEIRNTIEACAEGYAEVDFHSFNAREGTIVMSASSESVDNINCFISQLLKQPIFNRVDYTGYTYNDSKLCWDIHVTCTLSESAGR